MNQELNDFLNTLQGWTFYTEDVFSRNDFYYLTIQQKRMGYKAKIYRLLMNSDETPQDLVDYMLNRYKIEI